MLTIDAVTDLDRASHRRTDAAWLQERRAAPSSRFIVLAGLAPVIRTPPVLVDLSGAEVAAQGLSEAPSLFLGVDAEGAAWFALLLDEGANLPPNSAPADLRQLASEGVLSREALSKAGQARALVEWQRGCKFCGACGGPMHARDGGWRRQCGACEREQFPRTDPVVIMLPVCGDRALVARGVRFPTATYSALAGFLEPGEDIERAVQREVQEEVGLTVTAVTYQESQPWPFPHSLMIGCQAQVTDAPLTLDPGEIAEAYWITREEGQAMLEDRDTLGRRAPSRHAIARSLLEHFVEDRPFSAASRRTMG